MVLTPELRVLRSRLKLPIALLVITNVVGLDHLTSDAVRLARRRRKMEQAIHKLQKHFVLAGYGRVGREAARELKGAGMDVVVVEPDQEMAGSAADSGCLVMRQILEAGDHVLLLGTEAQMEAVERLLAEEPRARN